MGGTVVETGAVEGGVELVWSSMTGTGAGASSPSPPRTTRAAMVPAASASTASGDPFTATTLAVADHSDMRGA